MKGEEIILFVTASQSGIFGQVSDERRNSIDLFVTQIVNRFQNLPFGQRDALIRKYFTLAVFQPVFVYMKNIFNKQQDPVRRIDLAVHYFGKVTGVEMYFHGKLPLGYIEFF